MKYLRYSVGNFFSKISYTYYLLSAFIAIDAINDDYGNQEHCHFGYKFFLFLSFAFTNVPPNAFLGFNSNALVLRARMMVHYHSGPIYLFFFS